MVGICCRFEGAECLHIQCGRREDRTCLGRWNTITRVERWRHIPADGIFRCMHTCMHLLISNVVYFCRLQIFDSFIREMRERSIVIGICMICTFMSARFEQASSCPLALCPAAAHETLLCYPLVYPRKHLKYVTVLLHMNDVKLNKFCPFFVKYIHSYNFSRCLHS